MNEDKLNLTGMDDATLETVVQVDDVDTAGVANDPGVLIDGLARLPEKTILDKTRLAQELGVVGRTVQRMVQRGELPPPIRLGGRSCWFAGRVLAHLNAAFERAEKEAERHAAKLRALTS